MNLVVERPVKSRRRWTISLLLVLTALIISLAFWIGSVLDGRPEPLFHGKPESEWIKQVKYHDDEQVKQWRSYGEEGVGVLVRGLEKATHRRERAYRQFYRRFPSYLARWLPAAKPDSSQATRERLVSLLGSLGKDAKSAVPVLIRTARGDESRSVRQGAIGFFLTSPGDDCLLNQLPVHQKVALLPALLTGMKDPQLRQNASILLKFYPEQREVVSPVLVKALQGPEPYVRLYAAEALNRVAPDLAKKARATSLLVKFTRDPDNQLAAKAVAALGHSGSEPDLAVPALIECLRSTNSLIGCEAIWALEWAPQAFTAYSESIIPALSTAVQESGRGGYAKAALLKWQSRVKPLE